jgi:hypothetical protein
VGDFVLVSNADAVDPDTPEGCDIAQIIKLFETGNLVIILTVLYVCSCFSLSYDDVCYVTLL